jgi:hypothetical protein
MLLSISREYASSSTPGFSLRCPADRPHLTPKFVSRLPIYAPSRFTNLRVRRERQLRLTTGSDQPSLCDASSTDPNPTSLRHVLICTTGPSSLTTRRSVRASLSPITRRSGRHPRPTSVISLLYCSFHVECDCYTCSQLICNCLWNSRAVCGATRRACFLACRPGTAETTSMGWPRSAALEDPVIGLDWTGRGSCSRIKSISISSRQLDCNPMHATCRTQDDDVSLPIVSCYSQLHPYMQPRAFATSVSRCTTRRSHLQGRV